MKAQAQAKRAEQTKNAHSAFMKKMTKSQFSGKWGEVEGSLTLEELKQMTGKAKNAAVGERMEISKRFRGGCIAYTFERDGISLYVSAAFGLGGEKFPLNGRCKFGRVNGTKVSFDYGMLSRLLEELMERADSVFAAEEKITCRLVTDPEGGCSLIVPQGIEIKRVLYGKEADNE